MRGKFQRLIDYFALLDEPRRPWPDLDRLKTRFFELSATLHPDRHHEAPPAERAAATRDYTDLNAAYRCLSDPKERVLHLLELERSCKPAEIQPIADHLMSVGMDVGQLCRDIDRFLAATPATTAPLLQVQRFQQSQVWTEKALALQKQLITRRDEVGRTLEQMNPAWETAPPLGSPVRAEALPLTELEEQFRLLSFLDRWIAQLQQRITQLAL